MPSLADEATPISIGRTARRGGPGELHSFDACATPLGEGVAAMLRHLIAVLDREDRLESGTGEWLTGFRTDEAQLGAAVRHGVLRALRLSGDETNFRILEELVGTEGAKSGAVAERVGLTHLSLAERAGDLVSAGLVVKVPEANQLAATAAGAALVAMVHGAVRSGAAVLAGDQP